MLYKQQLEGELMRILPEKRSTVTTITHPTQLRYASILGYERHIYQEEPEEIMEQKEAAARQIVQCSIIQIAQQAWPPTRKLRSPSSSSSPPSPPSRYMLKNYSSYINACFNY
jgi:ABC-type nitrate/sulfonate/bicarbonate transport system ATPase subunit